MREPIKNFGWHVLTVVAGLTGAIGVVVAYLALSGVMFQGTSYPVRALLPTSSSLAVGARVTMAGVQVGRVQSVKAVGSGTLVGLELTDQRVEPIPADSRIMLRERTPIGENYVEIVAGHSRVNLPPNSLLPMGRASEYVDVDQLLSVLHGAAKLEARQIIDNSGAALTNRGTELNLVLGRASGVVVAAGHLFGILNHERGQTVDLVNQLGSVASAVAERSSAVTVAANSGLAALHAIASRDAALAATLDVLPSALTQVRVTSGTLAAASATATPVVTNLAAAVSQLRPAVAALAPAAATGRRVLATLGRASTPLTSTLGALERLSGPLPSATGQIHKAICQINPMIRYIAPYTKDVLAAIIGLDSSSNSYDAFGHLIRLTPILNANSIAGTLPSNVSQAMYTLLQSGLFIKGAGLSWNPYPKPGMIGQEQAHNSGNIFDAQALKASGYVYPHILADC
jgi:phospholipid/cholesterol/gamma-HCH transport system substrate-binding protein